MDLCIYLSYIHILKWHCTSVPLINVKMLLENIDWILETPGRSYIWKCMNPPHCEAKFPEWCPVEYSGSWLLQRQKIMRPTVHLKAWSLNSSSSTSEANRALLSRNYISLKLTSGKSKLLGISCWESIECWPALAVLKGN